MPYGLAPANHVPSPDYWGQVKKPAIFAGIMLVLLLLLCSFLWNLNSTDSSSSSSSSSSKGRDTRQAAEAKVWCEEAIEDRITREYKWSSGIFSRWAYSRRESDGDILVGGTELMIQNVYGAMEKWGYQCSYDPGMKVAEVTLLAPL